MNMVYYFNKPYQPIICSFRPFKVAFKGKTKLYFHGTKCQNKNANHLSAFFALKLVMIAVKYPLIYSRCVR